MTEEITKVWVYHATEEAKIIDSSELKEHLKNGWAESPADVKTAKKTAKKAVKKEEGE